MTIHDVKERKYYYEEYSSGNKYVSVCNSELRSTFYANISNKYIANNGAYSKDCIFIREATKHEKNWLNHCIKVEWIPLKDYKTNISDINYTGRYVHFIKENKYLKIIRYSETGYCYTDENKDIDIHFNKQPTQFKNKDKYLLMPEGWIPEIVLKPPIIAQKTEFIVGEWYKNLGYNKSYIGQFKEIKNSNFHCFLGYISGGIWKYTNIPPTGYYKEAKTCHISEIYHLLPEDHPEKLKFLGLISVTKINDISGSVQKNPVEKLELKVDAISLVENLLQNPIIFHKRRTKTNNLNL